MMINSAVPDEYDQQFATEEAYILFEEQGTPNTIELDHAPEAGLSRGGATALARRLDDLVGEWNYRIGRMPHPASLYDSTAEEMAVIAWAPAGNPDFIIVVSDQDESALCIDRHAARALARRLNKLADELECAVDRPVLRRLPDVDEKLRDRDV